MFNWEGCREVEGREERKEENRKRANGKSCGNKKKNQEANKSAMRPRRSSVDACIGRERERERESKWKRESQRTDVH